MKAEQRLIEALKELEDYSPSPDLFARVEASLAADRDFRRRRLAVVLASFLGLAAVTAWVGLSASAGPSGRLSIEAWKLVLAHLTVGGAIVITLAPHIRRFAKSFVDEVFHLSPETGARFLLVLDIAYYTAFTGVILVDADAWGLGRRLILSPALEDVLFRLGFLLFVMGFLHAVNIAVLPVLGLVYNSIVRTDLRRRAGDDAPAESMAARKADRNARGLAVAVAVLAIALVMSVVMGGGPFGLLLGVFA